MKTTKSTPILRATVAGLAAMVVLNIAPAAHSAKDSGEMPSHEPGFCGAVLANKNLPWPSLVLGVRGAEKEAQEYAQTTGQQVLKDSTQVASNKNILVRLTGQLMYREVTIVIPNDMNSDQLFEALIKIRTAKTLGARSIAIVPVNPRKGFRLALLNPAPKLDIEHLFNVAGADTVLYQGQRPVVLEEPSGFSQKRGVITTAPGVVIASSHSALAKEAAIAAGLEFSSDTLKELPKERMVYLFLDGGANPNENLLQALALIEQLVERKNNVMLVSPYLPYARSDKVDPAGGVTVTGRLVADLIEAVGTSSMIFLRAHAPQSQGFFRIPTVHLSSQTTLVPELRDLGVEKAISPDEGAQKSTTLFADDLGVAVSTVNKQRDPISRESRVLGISDSKVEGMTLAIIDDELDSGGTLAKVSDLLVSLGARRVYAVATHLTGPAVKALANANIYQVIVTDSIEITDEMRKNPKIRVVSVAPEIAAAMKEIELGRRGRVEP